jgi:hypothetical protein
VSLGKRGECNVKHTASQQSTLCLILFFPPKSIESFSRTSAYAKNLKLEGDSELIVTIGIVATEMRNLNKMGLSVAGQLRSSMVESVSALSI